VPVDKKSRRFENQIPDHHLSNKSLEAQGFYVKKSERNIELPPILTKNAKSALKLNRVRNFYRETED
jgi:hypothetical protein